MKNIYFIALDVKRALKWYIFQNSEYFEDFKMYNANASNENIEKMVFSSTLYYIEKYIFHSIGREEGIFLINIFIETVYFSLQKIGIFHDRFQ